MNAGHRLQKQTYLPLNPVSSQWGTQGRTDAVTTCIPTNDLSSAAVGSGAKESQAEDGEWRGSAFGKQGAGFLSALRGGDKGLPLCMAYDRHLVSVVK